MTAILIVDKSCVNPLLKQPGNLLLVRTLTPNDWLILANSVPFGSDHDTWEESDISQRMTLTYGSCVVSFERSFSDA